MGRRFEATRRLAGISIRGLTGRLGCSTASVMQWQNGIVPRASTRARIAKILGKPAEEIWAEQYALEDAMREVRDTA